MLFNALKNHRKTGPARSVRNGAPTPRCAAPPACRPSSTSRSTPRARIRRPGRIRERARCCSIRHRLPCTTSPAAPPRHRHPSPTASSHRRLRANPPDSTCRVPLAPLSLRSITRLTSITSHLPSHPLTPHQPLDSTQPPPHYINDTPSPIPSHTLNFLQIPILHPSLLHISNETNSSTIQLRHRPARGKTCGICAPCTTAGFCKGLYSRELWRILMSGSGKREGGVCQRPRRGEYADRARVPGPWPRGRRVGKLF